MSGFLTRHHYTGRVPGHVLAERLRENLLAASTGTVAGKSYSAQSFARLLQLLNIQLAGYDDAIAAAVAEHPDTPIFAGFPGLGPVLTCTLLAEIGEDRAASRHRRHCWPSPGWPRSPAPPAAHAKSASATLPTQSCARPRCGGPTTR
ncbi:hypothetical protein GCM10009836_25170 [Pseudonocardia ailaonensis]|uniref:Transposase IS116/IS110/IS902 family protein n=1 Tax=Pseudonocardia ailaonensis TaxID=367279 RepID=A0ABN2N044_9PSEU